MEKKKIGDITVNDGKGLFDNEGMCGLLLIDLNNLPKLLIQGQYIQYCTLVSTMSQKLINLQKGIKTDREALVAEIEELKQMNHNLVEQITGLPVSKDGAENGTD